MLVVNMRHFFARDAKEVVIYVFCPVVQAGWQ